MSITMSVEDISEEMIIEEEEDMEHWNLDSISSRATLSNEALRQYRAGYAASKMHLGGSCPGEASASSSSKDTVVHKMVHERTKLAHFKGTERRLSSRSAISEGGISMAPSVEFPVGMPDQMCQDIIAYYNAHGRLRRESEVNPDLEGFFHVVQASPHHIEDGIQDPNLDKYRAINRKEDAYNREGFIDDKSELLHVAAANRDIWGSRRHTDGYVKFLYHEALAGERDRVWRKVLTVNDFVPTTEDVMTSVPLDDLLPSQLDKRCHRTDKPVWWSERSALEKGSKETVQVIRHIHNKIQEMKEQRFEEYMEANQAEYKTVKFFDMVDQENVEVSKVETSSDESYILKPEPPFFIDESKLEEEDVIEDPYRSPGLHDILKDTEPPSDDESSDESQRTLRSLISTRSSRAASRLLKKKMFSVPVVKSADLTMPSTVMTRMMHAESSELTSTRTSSTKKDNSESISRSTSRATIRSRLLSISTMSSYGEEHFEKLRRKLVAEIEELNKAGKGEATAVLASPSGYTIHSTGMDKIDDLVDDSSIESVFKVGQFNSDDTLKEEEDQEVEIEPPPPRLKRYASPFLNAVLEKSNKPKDDSLFSIKDALMDEIEVEKVKYEPYALKRPPYKGYDDYLELKQLVKEVAAPFMRAGSVDPVDDDFAFVRKPPPWKRIQKRCHRMAQRSDRLVQIYKCMCQRLGLPTYELVARSLYSKTADFTRLGLTPPGSMRVAFTLLERNHRLQQIYLTGLTLHRDDVIHLNTLFCKAPLLQRVLLNNTKLGAEHLNMLRDSIKEMPNLCFLDLSSNRIGDKGLVMFLRGMTEITNISTLVLKNNGLTVGCLPGFKTVLANWTSITSLDLSWNEISDGAPFLSFANYVQRHETMQLKELRMAWNGMEGNACANAIAVFCNMRTMKYMDISFNNFNTEEEMAIFSHLISQAPSLEFFIMQDNPIRGVPASVLLSDLVIRNQLKLIDLGDVWLDKQCAQTCDELYIRYGVRVKFSQIMANFDISPPDMRKIYIQRTQFLNRKTKKKNLGQMLMKLEYKKRLFPMKRSEFYHLLETTRLKLDEGLDIALARVFIHRHRVDVVQMLRIYKELYPNAKFLGAKKKKKKKKKKGKRASSDDGLPIDEADYPDPNLRELWTTKFIEKKSFVNARYLRDDGGESDDEDEKEEVQIDKFHFAKIMMDQDEPQIVDDTTETTVISTDHEVSDVTTDDEATTEAVTEEVSRLEASTIVATEEVTSTEPLYVSTVEEVTANEATTIGENDNTTEGEEEG